MGRLTCAAYDNRLTIIDLRIRPVLSLYKASTGLCADSIEAVPGVGGLFTLATYQVDKEELLTAGSNNRRNSGSSSLCETNHGEQAGVDEEQSASPVYTRRGTCTLHRIASSQATPGQRGDGLSCETLQTIDTPAILDLKWSVTAPASSNGQRRILGIANARGEVELQRLAQTQDKLEHVRTLALNDHGGKTLCLSLDWSDRFGYERADKLQAKAILSSDTSLVVSQSDGSLCFLPSLEAALSHEVEDEPETAAVVAELASVGLSAPDDEDEWERTSQDEKTESLKAAHASLNKPFAARPRGLETWKAHEYEAWIVGFDCWSSSGSQPGLRSVVWSGGDDLSLRGWDLRSPNISTGRSPTFTTSKCFEGGVTTLQSSHIRQHLWAVGSYDGKLRLFDARSTYRPISETDMGGGIWRVKWHPTDAARLLLGCMHDGFKIVRLDGLADPAAQSTSFRGSDFEIVKRFDEHESLAYGCDWDRREDDSGEEENRLVYSCSFYDAALHVWRS